MATLGLWLFLAASAASPDVRQASFTAPSLGRQVSLVVQLPPSYEKAKARRFPVVYALHGLFEGASFWQSRGLAPALDALWAKGEIPEFVVVAIDGGNSFFVNAPSGRYEDLVTTDAPAWVEANYRVVPGRAGRGLWGVSMGGYAALRIALERPSAFRAVATHSAMLLERPPTAADGAGSWQMAAFHKVFGDPIDEALWLANSPLDLAAKADAGSSPEIRFDCGSEDRYGLFRGNGDLHRRLEARKVKHTYELLPGDHGYEYVLSVFQKGVAFLGAALQAQQPGK